MAYLLMLGVATKIPDDACQNSLVSFFVRLSLSKMIPDSEKGYGFEMDFSVDFLDFIYRKV